MSYLDIVSLVFMIIGCVLGLSYAHFAVFFIIGLFVKKKYPHTEEKLKYGIIIPARDEEKVVGNLIDSILKNKYPQDKLQIFVMAHNCKDKTAEIARAKGVTVYEYNCPTEKTKGYALRYLFNKIDEDFGINSYDGFFFFDTDNILTENYIDKMNDAFVARGKHDIITSYRNSKNFGTNLISALYGFYFLYSCIYDARGRTACNCSTRVPGTGFVVSAESVKDGWNYVTLAEDCEFSVDQILKGHKVIYCDEAMFYDEQPTDVKTMLRQRTRWQRGHLIVCATRIKDLLRGLFRSSKKGGGKYKFSIYDMTVNILPILVTTLFIFILQAGLTALTPIISSTSAAETWTRWGIGTAISMCSYYFSTLFLTIVLAITERKRINGVSLPLEIAAIILCPLFLYLTVPIEAICLFKPHVEWKPIKHKDDTAIEHVGERRERRKK